MGEKCIYRRMIKWGKNSCIYRRMIKWGKNSYINVYIEE